MTREESKGVVAPGWAKLIDKIYDIADGHVYYLKEKYGRLSVFWEGVTVDVEDKIIEIERESEKVCSLCGDDGEIRTDRSWYVCLCNKCNKK